MTFNDALGSFIADLTPQPWEHTTPRGTLRVIPAGLREDPGEAEVLIRVTHPDASGLGEYNLTTPDSRGVAEVGVPTRVLPSLIGALTERTSWEAADLVAGMLSVFPGEQGVVVCVTEVHSGGWAVSASMEVPDGQRLPLVSALRRALDVARGWEG